MKKLTLFLITALIAVSLQTQSTNTLTIGRNQFRHGDGILKQQVEYVDPGSAGRQIVWNFSRVNAINEKYYQVFFRMDQEDTTRIVDVEHDTRYFYQLKSDTLWLTGYENRMSHMDFVLPEAQLHFPFHYGDSLTSYFQGKGMYCQKVEFPAKGKTTVTADAMGKLITPDGDTLCNVSRVKRVREYSEIGVDSVKMRLETYSWYARGYRYPMFETVKSLILRGDSTTEHFSTSFYFPIRNIDELAEDTENKQTEADPAIIDDVLHNCHTMPNPVVNDLQVQYELSKSARVSFLLCDQSGRIWLSVPEKSLESGTQSQKIGMSSMYKGDYMLNIIVDGQVYRMKIIKI